MHVKDQRKGLKISQMPGPQFWDPTWLDLLRQGLSKSRSLHRNEAFIVGRSKDPSSHFPIGKILTIFEDSMNFHVEFVTV